MVLVFSAAPSLARLHRPRFLVSSFLLLLALALPAAVAASDHPQVSPAYPPGHPPALELHAYSFRYQVAREALPLVYPLLTARGTVELQPESNTLVIRDQPDALRRIMSVLAAFDHPPRAIRLKLQMIEAGPRGVSPPSSHALPPALRRQLHELLRFDAYRVVAEAILHTREGESVSYDLGPAYRVRFRLGTAIRQRLKLRGFTIEREVEGSAKKSPPLVHADLNLWLSEPLILGLTRDESSRHALMVVVDGRLERERQ